MSGNPLLDKTYRIPFHRIGAQHVEPGVREALARAQEEVDELARDPEPRSWGNTLSRLDDITQRLSETLAPLDHLLSVAETPKLREAYNAVLPEITQFWSRLVLNQDLWNQLKDYAGTSEARALTGLAARHLEKTLREFRRAGADLPPQKKARLEEIRVEMARLGQKFGENVLDATAAFELLITEETRLEGIPSGPRKRFREAAEEKEMEGWLLTLDFPSYEAVIKYAADRKLRQEVHQAYVGRCREGEFENTPLIPQILALRQEMAELLGYRHFPDYRLEEAMARSGDNAVAFEADLVARTRPFWEGDVEMLREHAAELGIPELQPWDVAFVAESLRKARYEIDDEILRPFFPLEAVMDGLFGLVHRLFGLSVTEKSITEVWHPDVRFYEVRDESGTFLGSFYTDWFPRKEKRQGAWMNAFRSGGPRPDGSFEPHLGFIAGNFAPPEDDEPSLLNHREVQTIFHEFGHLLHHLTSRVPIPGRGGLNVAWDWVELPSQILENWSWEEEALALFARHYETGEALPGEILERMLAARRFMGGWQQMRQLSFGTLDLALHGELAPELFRGGAGDSHLPAASGSPHPAGGGNGGRPEDADGTTSEDQPGGEEPGPLAPEEAAAFEEDLGPLAPEEAAAFEEDLGPLAPDEAADAGERVMAFAVERLLSFSPGPDFARSHILTTFSHLFSGGYAAGYYSYLWSEVLDADAFSRFKAEGVLNPATGRAYLDTILSRGDSADPEDLFREFMGRDPDPEALLMRNLGP